MKILTKEANEIRKKIDNIVKDMNVKELQDKKLNITIDIYEDWTTKVGDVKKKDIANREKFLVDSIFKSMGIDDKFIFKQTFRKIQSKEEKAVIDIQTL